MELYRAGKIEVELVPQGNLACRIQAAGMGLRLNLHPTGFWYLAGRRQTDHELRRQRTYVLENPIKAELALIKAQQGYRWGTLVYRNLHVTLAQSWRWLLMSRLHKSLKWLS